MIPPFGGKDLFEQMEESELSHIDAREVATRLGFHDGPLLQFVSRLVMLAVQGASNAGSPEDNAARC